MHSVRIELAKLISVGTRITYQATGDAGSVGFMYSRFIFELVSKACFRGEGWEGKTTGDHGGHSRRTPLHPEGLRVPLVQNILIRGTKQLVSWNVKCDQQRDEISSLPQVKYEVPGIS